MIDPDGRSPTTSTVPAHGDDGRSRAVAEARTGHRASTVERSGSTTYRVMAHESAAPRDRCRRDRLSGHDLRCERRARGTADDHRHCTSWPSTCWAPASTPPPATSACRWRPVGSGPRPRPTGTSVGDGSSADGALVVAPVRRRRPNGRPRSRRSPRRPRSSASTPGMPASRLHAGHRARSSTHRSRSTGPWPSRWASGSRSATPRSCGSRPTTPARTRAAAPCGPSTSTSACRWPRSTTASRPATSCTSSPTSTSVRGRPAKAPFWNEPFGASVTASAIASVDDAVAFFEQGRWLAAGSS